MTGGAAAGLPPEPVLSASEFAREKWSMMENKNLILAIVLSVVILIGFQLVADRLLPQPTSPQPSPGAGSSEGQGPSPDGAVAPTPAQPGAVAPGVAPPGAPSAPTPVTEPAGRARSDVIAATPRVRINTPELHGSIALIGGRVDDLTLVNYRETIDPNSPEIVLFSPPGSADPYFAELGWVAAPAGVALPGPTTRWEADGAELVANRPLTLTWDNGAGLVFKRIYNVDEHFMFTITQEVENRGGEPVSVNPYSVLARWGTPETSQFFILHEGPIARDRRHPEGAELRGPARPGRHHLLDQRRLARLHRQVLARRADPDADGAGRGALRPHPRRRDGQVPGRLRRRCTNRCPWRQHQPADDVVRRRQAGAPARPLRRAVRHQALRSRHRLRLVLLPHQAVLPVPHLHQGAGRQLRRRHPDPDGLHQARVLPAGQQVVPGDEPDAQADRRR